MLCVRLRRLESLAAVWPVSRRPLGAGAGDVSEPGGTVFSPELVRRAMLKGMPVYHVGRFARVKHKRVGELWHVLHVVTTDDTWWRGHMMARYRRGTPYATDPKPAEKP
jgi:hypothetical protein